MFLLERTNQLRNNTKRMLLVVDQARNSISCHLLSQMSTEKLSLNTVKNPVNSVVEQLDQYKQANGLPGKFNQITAANFSPISGRRRKIPANLLLIKVGASFGVNKATTIRVGTGSAVTSSKRIN